MKADELPRHAAQFALHGIAVSGGVAIGRASILDAGSLDVPRIHVAPESVEAECARLSAAIKTVADELEALLEALPPGTPAEMGAFIDVHAMILRDPTIAQVPLALIRSERYNAEWALATQADSLIAQFEQIEDSYLRERQNDVRQVVERVLRVLSGRPGAAALSASTGSATEPLLIIAHDIAPADMLHLKGTRFAGFATDLGGSTSHTAIVARGLGLPAVVGLQHGRELIREGDLLVIDGDAGVVIVNPDAGVLADYERRRAAHTADRESLKLLRFTEARTAQGRRVRLLANIELPEDVERALEAGADGIGLFRSEFLFMERSELPTEDEQFDAYAHVVRRMAGRPVTIRTLDIGADKTLAETDRNARIAPNPALGLRAIRYCLAHPEMFLTQLRAILRASALGPVKLLIPMLAHEHEIDQTLAMIEQARRELASSGHAFDEKLQVGGMIEIPGAALLLEVFAERLDFLSLGTNDLIQYTLAIDRTDSSVAHLYDPAHPAVMKLIRWTIDAGRAAGKPVSLCGEMAGEVDYTRMLLDMGLDEFSMHPSQLPSVKRAVLATG